MKLSDEQRERLIMATRDMILEVRRMCLQRGASPLKLWDLLHDRTRAASRTCANAQELATNLMRNLQIAAPSSRLSHSMAAMAEAVRVVGDAPWLDLLEREHGYVIAVARLEAERRRDGRKEIESEWAEASTERS